MNKIPSDSWLQTTEIEELVQAVEHCAELASAVPYDVTRWKWLIPALHIAIQGAFVCALRGNDPASTAMLTPESARSMRRWWTRDSRRPAPPPRPVERLLPLPSLYKRAVSPEYLGKPYTLAQNRQTRADLAKLIRLRQELSTFIPGGFALEVGALAGLVRTCCGVIEHLAVSHPTFWRHLQRVEKKRIDFALTALRKAMNKREARA